MRTIGLGEDYEFLDIAVFILAQLGRSGKTDGQSVAIETTCISFHDIHVRKYNMSCICRISRDCFLSKQGLF